MKIFRSLRRWGTLYVLFGIFIAGFFWEESLDIKPIYHKILAIGILFSFSILLTGWITRHESNFIVPQIDEIGIILEKPERSLERNEHPVNEQS